MTGPEKGNGGAGAGFRRTFHLAAVSGMHDREGRCRRTTGKLKIAVAMWGPLGTERRALPQPFLRGVGRGLGDSPLTARARGGHLHTISH